LAFLAFLLFVTVGEKGNSINRCESRPICFKLEADRVKAGVGKMLSVPTALAATKLIGDCSVEALDAAVTALGH
jgi:hypothetical protein